MCAGVTMLLTLSVLQLVINDKLPTTSDAIPIIGKLSMQSSYKFINKEITKGIRSALSLHSK